MIFCISADKAGGSLTWKKAFACRQAQHLHNAWLETRSTVRAHAGQIFLYEWRGSNFERDVYFLLGYLYSLTKGFCERFTGSPVILLHSSEKTRGLALHNPVELESRRLYPDIILRHDFDEMFWMVDTNTLLHCLYTACSSILAPHQLFGFSLNPSLEKKEFYRFVNRLKTYAQALDNLHLEGRKGNTEQTNQLSYEGTAPLVESNDKSTGTSGRSPLSSSLIQSEADIRF